MVKGTSDVLISTASVVGVKNLKADSSWTFSVLLLTSSMTSTTSTGLVSLMRFSTSVSFSDSCLSACPRIMFKLKWSKTFMIISIVELGSVTVFLFSSSGTFSGSIVVISGASDDTLTSSSTSN